MIGSRRAVFQAKKAAAERAAKEQHRQYAAHKVLHRMSSQNHRASDMLRRQNNDSPLNVGYGSASIRTSIRTEPYGMLTWVAPAPAKTKPPRKPWVADLVTAALNVGYRNRKALAYVAGTIIIVNLFVGLRYGG